MTTGGLKKRILRVTFSFPEGDVVLDETLDLKVAIKKQAFAVQNEAVITVTGLTSGVRRQLTQFTAYNQRLVDTGKVSVTSYINVSISAGYISTADGTNTVSETFKGQVVLCRMIEGPPNMTFEITCFTHQVDKTTYITTPAPESMTFKDFVRWAGGWMGFDLNHIKCSTSKDNEIIYNPARSVIVAAGLLPYIQSFFSPKIFAMIDDDFLIVSDANKVINATDIATLNEFIGPPSSQQWGCEFTIFFNPSIRVASAVNIESSVNPILNGTYVLTNVEIELTSRDQAFYTHALGVRPS